jgi:hypothetical protein
MMASALVALFAGMSLATCKGDGNGDDVAGTDADADGDDDGIHEDYCDDDLDCYSYCSEALDVPSNPPGTAATLDAICTDTSSPVVSTSAAVVELDADGDSQLSAIGLVRIPGDLLERIIGFPEIGFSVLAYGDEDKWSTYEITDLTATDDGFAFLVGWPLGSPWVDCDYGDPMVKLSCTVDFHMDCDLADGGLPEDAGTLDGGPSEIFEVQAVTNLEWCYDWGSATEAGTPDWQSSGEECPFSCSFAWDSYCE